MFLIFLATTQSLTAQTNELPALVPAYAELPPTFWEQHGTLLIMSGGALIILAALVVWKLIQPKPVVVLPPEVIAREALIKLQGRHEDGKVLSEVSQVLRGYLGTVFQMPGAELTTAECYSVVMPNDKIGLTLRESIFSFLHECDAQKFSPADETTPLNAVSRALAIVARVEKETHGQDARATTR